jgi:hypothetical protein
MCSHQAQTAHPRPEKRGKSPGIREYPNRTAVLEMFQPIVLILRLTLVQVLVIGALSTLSIRVNKAGYKYTLQASVIERRATSHDDNDLPPRFSVGQADNQAPTLSTLVDR